MHPTPLLTSHNRFHPVSLLYLRIVILSLSVDTMKRTHDESYSSEDDSSETNQVGGGDLFTFTMSPVGRRRRWQHVVDHTQFQATLIQNRDPRPHEDLGQSLTEALYSAIRRQITDDAAPHHMLHVAVQANGFTHAFRSLNMTVRDFTTRDDYVDELLNTMADQLNSNESFDPSEGLAISVILVRLPSPGSRPKNLALGRRRKEEDDKRKKKIIRIQNRDELCCARAIVTMMAWCHRNDHVRFDSDVHPWREWRNCREGRAVQTTRARALHLAAGVPEGPCGYPELQKFQDHLYRLDPPYQLKVIIRHHPFFMYFRGERDLPLVVQLVKDEDHYNGCTKFNGIVNRSYWCPLCDKGFDSHDAKQHPCDGRTCRACNRSNCPDYDRFQSPRMECPRCHIRFYGQQCLQFHQTLKNCSKEKRCLSCCKQYKVDNKNRHYCFYDDCNACGQRCNLHTHKCFIQKPPQDPPRTREREESHPPPRLVYADIECLTDEDRGFYPTLLCYQGEWQPTVTTLRDSDCNEDETVVDVFLDHLTDFSYPATGPVEEQAHVIIFHNLKGFDGVFLLHSLYKKARTVEDQINVGNKVLSFSSGPLTFKDSLCFLPMPLANFPKTFGITEMKKGFFPHLFNTPDNQGYVGPLPDLTYFDPDGMSPAKKSELVAWHAEQTATMTETGQTYDFQRELEAYCESDVDILKAGCEAFAEEFTRKAKFNPFLKCYTIASACNRYWRQHHLPEDAIAVEPPRGWRGARVNQSWVALQWLAYQQSLLPPGQTIQHVRNGGEYKAPTRQGHEFVDGFNPSTNTVYEFWGCLWHGCRLCFPQQRWKEYAANHDRTLNELRDVTETKRQRLTERYTLIDIWECQWAEQVKNTPAIQTFLNGLQQTPPLQPRDAFFGGRTGAVTLHQLADATQGEKILYIDVTSLYPWVNKTAKYPVGHPEIKYEPEDQRLASYFGIALVRIRPPRGLFHPVLPVRHGEKLTFPLCMACVKQEQAKPMLERSATCRHSDEERDLVGTWCTPELVEAEKQGYLLQRIHEVWHFKETETGLFADYVNTWLKIKQESAGWPRWCQTSEQKAQYVRNYKEKEGIDLTNVAPNPGKKQVAKLMLNSFWGKFGERTNKPKVEQITRPSELFRVMTGGTNDLQDLRVCTSDVLEVKYKQISDNDEPSVKTNIFVACFTTCWARLKLYSYLHRLKERVLYYDTDSVIYTCKSDQQPIEIGDFLGEMTDELDGDSIAEFISGGAKNYGYRTVGGKVCCKVRGFTLNVRGREKLNFDTMKQHILTTLHPDEDDDEDEGVITVTNPHYFKRDPVAKKIKLDIQKKQYRLVFDKRVLQGVTSVPYGYY